MENKLSTLKFKRVTVAISLILALILSNTALADDGGTMEHTAPHWQATYWNNTALRGTPVFQRQETTLNHDWSFGSPHFKVQADRFSARWTRTIDVSPGTYRFTATSDDGIRVWVDSELIIDQWHDHPPTTHTGDVGLMAGHHLVVMEYYENTGYAQARLSWEPASLATGSWRAEYYANPLLGAGCMPPSISTDCRVIVRQDPQIDFDWGWGAPLWSMPSDRFSVRWTRTAHLEPGSYRFTATTDDGVRLWVNQHLLIDNWRDQALASRSRTIYLDGDVALNMEYYENGGVAAARLTWEREVENPPPAVERILFAPGTTQTTVAGYLPANHSKVYVMRLAAGQYVAMDATVGAAGQGLRFSIVGADGTVVKRMGEAHVRTVVPGTQDYYVRLVSDVGAVSYRMSVLIPVRVRFAPGAISAQVGGSLAANGMRHYVLRALAGQRMIVVPHTVQGHVRSIISGADGQVLLSGRVGRPGGVYDGILPTPQDYLITVRAEGGTGADYTLEITIPPL
ncbi:MAG: PA14 domain-containing protein [Anaerolineae bacterium]|jgi:hypothetical protein